MTFSERYSSLNDTAEKIFQKVKSFRHNERKRDGRGEKNTEISMFLELFKNRSPQYKSHARRHVCAKFGASRSRDGRETLAGEKKEKNKSTEKYNITEILKNCIFAKTEI
jgi:hypothetical protein